MVLSAISSCLAWFLINKRGTESHASKVSPNTLLQYEQPTPLACSIVHILRNSFEIGDFLKQEYDYATLYLCATNIDLFQSKSSGRRIKS